MKPKGVTTQMKALDEYFLMVVFTLFLSRVLVFTNYTSRNKAQFIEHHSYLSMEPTLSVAAAVAVSCSNELGRPATSSGSVRRIENCLVASNTLLLWGKQKHNEPPDQFFSLFFSTDINTYFLIFGLFMQERPQGPSSDLN